MRCPVQKSAQRFAVWRRSSRRQRSRDDCPDQPEVAGVVGFAAITACASAPIFAITPAPTNATVPHLILTQIASPNEFVSRALFIFVFGRTRLI